MSSLEQEAVRMETLVERLLQLARSDEGAPLILESHDLRAIVESAVTQARSSARTGITIRDEIQPKPITVRCDVEQIRGVIAIVLENAVKFSPSDGEVAIRLGATAEEATIAISDQGPGIALADQERIFERFYRAETSRTTTGTGLGLAIAHETTTRHGGSIDVESAPGEGATFTIRLPLRDAGAEGLGGGVR